MNAEGDLTANVLVEIQNQLDLAKFRVFWQNNMPYFNITHMKRTPESYIMATPTKSGEVIKVALEGVSNNTMLFSPTTPRSYNIQACLSSVCGPTTMIELAQLSYAWKDSAADSTNLYFYGPTFSLPSTDLTFETWMYSDSFGYGNLHAFSIQTTTKKYAVILRCYTGSVMNIYINEQQYSTSVACPKDEWVHYALVIVGTNVKLYLNSELKHECTTSSALVRETSRLIIGNHADAVLPTDLFNGSHKYYGDDKTTGVRVLNTALSVPNLQKIRALGPTDWSFYPDNLVAALSPNSESGVVTATSAYLTVEV
eukprot:TRINITY_DN43021_c0_g1_i1.p1 TRINITY_DN43021_c0_g1~~TRINITY_DN43021_c0_g1_i1.p1  ORF type:complete len:323 (+),score=29.19 TRINITY_DN43021_c0_g1_i1:34-969(+)